MLVFTVAFILAPFAVAAEQQPRVSSHARSLAATCANCHTADGALVPTLNGMPEDIIVRAMQDFKSGQREGTVMRELAKGYSDAQIKEIAAWYARAGR